MGGGVKEVGPAVKFPFGVKYEEIMAEITDFPPYCIPFPVALFEIYIPKRSKVIKVFSLNYMLQDIILILTLLIFPIKILDIPVMK